MHIAEGQLALKQLNWYRFIRSFIVYIYDFCNCHTDNLLLSAILFIVKVIDNYVKMNCTDCSCNALILFGI